MSDAGNASSYTVEKLKLHPTGAATQLHLSIKGKKTRNKAIIDDPEPGNLTITLEDQGADIDPVATVLVFFVEEFDEGP